MFQHFHSSVNSNVPDAFFRTHLISDLALTNGTFQFAPCKLVIKAAVIKFRYQTGATTNLICSAETTSTGQKSTEK